MNIYDMAKEAGVSIATISRVINRKSVVSNKTREKVEGILKKYNYAPSEIARGLVVNSMRTVGVMAMDIRDVYYANVAYTVEQELSKLGYNVILCNTGEDSKEKIKYMKTLMQKKVDGIIFVGSVFKGESLDRFISGIAGKIPVVMINGILESDNVYSVLCDDKLGTSLAVDHMAGHGRNSLVYLQDADSYSARSKVEGFKWGMQKHNKAVGDYNIIRVKKGFNGGYEGIDMLLSKGCSFDGVVCGDDMTAVGVLKSLKRHNIKVPEEVAVTGFNNSVLALCSEPSLTSVDSMIEEMGRNAVRIFSMVMDGEEVQSVTVIKPVLCERESV
jgi:DNA-binding LacI/PurR family transcriptional regulator